MKKYGFIRDGKRGGLVFIFDYHNINFTIFSKHFHIIITY